MIYYHIMKVNHYTGSVYFYNLEYGQYFSECCREPGTLRTQSYTLAKRWLKKLMEEYQEAFDCDFYIHADDYAPCERCRVLQNNLPCEIK